MVDSEITGAEKVDLVDNVTEVFAQLLGLAAKKGNSGVHRRRSQPPQKRPPSRHGGSSPRRTLTPRQSTWIHENRFTVTSRLRIAHNLCKLIGGRCGSSLVFCISFS